MTVHEKLEIGACTVLPETVAPETPSQPSCAAFVFIRVGVLPAGARLGSNGRVSVAGAAKAVPCGVNANIGPSDVLPGGNAGAPAPSWAIVMVVGCASAPAGTTSCAPAG